MTTKTHCDNCDKVLEDELDAPEVDSETEQPTEAPWLMVGVQSLGGYDACSSECAHALIDGEVMKDVDILKEMNVEQETKTQEAPSS